MRVNHYLCRSEADWASVGSGFAGLPQLVLVFGQRELLPGFQAYLQ